jgi:hypothetical protein
MRLEDEAAPPSGSVWQGRILIVLVLLLGALTIFGLLFIHPNFDSGA